MGKKCCDCGGDSPHGGRCPSCRLVLNNLRRSRRSRFIGPPLPPTPMKPKFCPECGTEKTDSNCTRLKTGRYAGEFIYHCDSCNRHRLRENYRLKKLGLLDPRRKSRCGACGVVKSDKNAERGSGGKFKRLCSDCDNAAKFDRRKMTEKRKSQCTKCGEVKTKENCGLVNGEFSTICKECRRRKRWDLKGSVEGQVTCLISEAQSRAKYRRMDFDLDYDFVLNMFIHQESTCSLSGVRFQFDPPEAGKRCNLLAPSLDRIDVKKGYIKGNVRLILYGINLAISDFGLDGVNTWVIPYAKKLLGLTDE